MSQILVTFFITGNDSDTKLKISEACKKLNYDLNCIAIPKTVIMTK